jgi:Cu/Ag efflux protein CusF
MKSVSAILVLAVAAVVMAVAPMAWAADVVQGKIKSVDPSGKMVTLANGTKLTIPPTLTPTLTVEEKSALKPGANVRASYEEKGGQKVATALMIMPSR